MSCFSMSVLRFVTYSTRVHWRLMASHGECLSETRPHVEQRGTVGWAALESQHPDLVQEPHRWLAEWLSFWASVSSPTHRRDWTTLLSTLKFNQEVSQQEVYWALIAAENKNSISLLTSVFYKEKQSFIEKQLQTYSGRRKEEVAALF